jgi:L-ascorbate metabolism protein UlaG (beta-lactamase superfamily)
VTTCRVTHVGGPTVLLEVEGYRILTDPTFDPPGRRYPFGLGTASTKIAGPALAPDDLGPLDAVLLSHDQHADNLDDAGRALLERTPVVVCTRAGATRLGRGARGLDAWDQTRLERSGGPPIVVTATPCRHGPPLSRALVGDVTGFALAWDGQRHGVVWVSGDTVLYDGVREVARRLTVDLALLHLGDVRFPITGPVHYTMTAEEAVELCRELRPRTAVPVHYEGWSHFHENRAGIDAALARAPADVAAAFRILPIGVPTDIEIG